MTHAVITDASAGGYLSAGEAIALNCTMAVAYVRARAARNTESLLDRFLGHNDHWLTRVVVWLTRLPVAKMLRGASTRLPRGGVADLLFMLASWGPCKGCPADFDGNGTVGASDLLVLLANWGPCP